MKLGQRIREVIDERGLSIEETARRAGMARSQLNKILAGETRSPGIINFSAIARSLDVSVDYLLLGVDDVGTRPTPAELDAFADLFVRAILATGAPVGDVAVIADRHVRASVAAMIAPS